MKPFIAALLAIVFAGCSRDSSGSAITTAPKSEAESLEQRVQALDDYLAKGGTPEPPAVAAPVLQRRAAEEFSARVLKAQKKESQIRFVSDMFAIVSISYFLPGEERSHTQEIHFLFGDHRWNLFWIPESPKANNAATPTSVTSPAAQESRRP